MFTSLFSWSHQYWPHGTSMPVFNSFSPFLPRLQQKLWSFCFSSHHPFYYLLTLIREILIVTFKWFNLDCLTGLAGRTEKWLLKLPKEGETVLWGSCFMNKSARYSAGHRRKWLTNWQYRWNCHGKVFQILWACRLKMDVSIIQKNFVQTARCLG